MSDTNQAARWLLPLGMILLAGTGCAPTGQGDQAGRWTPSTAYTVDWRDELHGARLDESQVAVTLVVDPRHGSDQADGSPETPLRTLGAALQRAREPLANRTDTRIHLRPGTHEAALTLSAGQLPALLVIEGEDPNTTVLAPPAGSATGQDAPPQPGPLLAVRRKINLVIRGLTFRGSLCRRWGGGALEITDGHNVLVEHCRFLDSRAGGLVALRCRELTVRHCRAENNGAVGVDLRGGRDLVVANVHAVGNGHGDWPDDTREHIAGLWTGFGLRRALFQNLVLTDNHGDGLRVDTDTRQVLIEGLRSIDNGRNGLVVASCQGPVSVTGSILAGNGRSGALLVQSARGVLAGNVLDRNLVAQIEVRPGDGQPVLDRDTGRPLPVDLRDWRWVDNVLSAGPLLAHAVEAPLHQPLMQTLHSERNLWWAGGRGRLPVKLAGLPMSLNDWRLATGEDLQSIEAPPRFAAPERGIYRPAVGSPLTSRDRWPVRQAPSGGPNELGRRRIERVAHMQRQAVANAPTGSSDRFERVNLRAQANRPLVGPGAWMGLPLNQVTPGRHRFGGVPFQVIDQQTNGLRAGIALRSAKVRKTRNRPVPRQVELPLQGRAERLYVLHLAALAEAHQPIAQYELVYQDGTTRQLDVTPLGRHPADADRLRQRLETSSIQDWWPTFPQFSSDTAIRVPVLAEDRPLESPRYLYVLRWDNPQPHKVLSALRLRSIAPDADPSVMILAVTLQRPPDDRR